jgi:hypothetical protein
MLTLKMSPYANVILIFDFDFGLDHLFMGDMDEGALHREERK